LEIKLSSLQKEIQIIEKYKDKETVHVAENIDRASDKNKGNNEKKRNNIYTE